MNANQFSHERFCLFPVEFPEISDDMVKVQN